MLAFKLNSNYAATFGLSSLLIIGVLGLSSDAEAVSRREPDLSLNTRQDCVNKYGHITFFNQYMTMSTAEDNTSVWCFFGTAHIQKESNQTVTAAPATVDYARDNLKLYYSISRSMNFIRFNIPGGNGVQGAVAPERRLGHNFVHNLTKIGEDNGVAIWRITPNDEVGLKMWTASSCGPDGFAYAARPHHAVNDHKAISGWRDSTSPEGDAAVRAKGAAGCNYFMHLASEIVLLKPNSVTGRVTIPEIQLGTVQLQTASHAIIAGKIDYPITLPAMTFNFKARTCTYSGAKDIQVKLDKIGLGHFANGRNEVYGGTTTINLTCPANSNVHSFVTFTDNSKIDNKSNILSLTRDSTAKNVGIKVYVNDDQNAVNFGPLVLQEGTEGTAGRAIAKQDYAREVAPASNAAKTHSLKLTAKYARINNQPITPGKVNGEMIFNFSYY